MKAALFWKQTLPTLIVGVLYKEVGHTNVIKCGVKYAYSIHWSPKLYKKILRKLNYRYNMKWIAYEEHHSVAQGYKGDLKDIT